MRDMGGRLLFSASDLMRFSGCRHATTLDLQRLHGTAPIPRQDTEDAELLQRHGDAHEAAYLEALKAQGLTVVEMTQGDLVENARETADVLRAGPAVVFQGALYSGKWGGWSDFLVRVERPSKLGPFSYEVIDTKLKRKADPNHVLQLVLYSDLLAEVQGLAPEHARIALGDGNEAVLRLRDYEAYARSARARLEAFISDLPETRPVPCKDCALCRWAEHCESLWVAEDSLFQVANITNRQVKKLEAVGIETMSNLAELDERVPGLAQATRERLVAQARLQAARRSSGPTFELRPREPGKGFDLLPEPKPGDLFYDIEGDPHVDGGLEYLHGVWDGYRFQAFWAHDHAEEAGSLQDLLTYFRSHLERFPEARIYHYAPYEVTALRRLTQKSGIGEAFLDRLLRERRLVDLFAVVRGGLIASEKNYSIKSMEVFYGRSREGEVTTAGGSVVAYEKWRETGAPEILEEIRAYNEVDCISTQELRDWLVTIRPDGPWPVPAAEASEQEAAADAESQELKALLDTADLEEARRAMLFDLGLFHRREAKPAWWSVFDSHGKELEELFDDREALGGLSAIGKPEPEKRSFKRRYTYPPQETKLRAGQRPTVPRSEGIASVQVLEHDRGAREITVKAGPSVADVLGSNLSLHPEQPLSTETMANAARSVIADQCGPRRFRAVDDLLSRRPPRLEEWEVGILKGDPVDGTLQAVRAMDETVLPIQGPPGTGKTYVTARAILALLGSGQRVAVTSNSHEAIRNVLLGIVEAYDESEPDLDLSIVHRTSDGDAYVEHGNRIEVATNNDHPALMTANVVGGTAWLLSRDEYEQVFDWLFVDEAGQVALANMAAMGRAARNIVLVGDPRQLPQVIQGAHPEPMNLSCLEWMLGDDQTLAPDRGIFLPESRRMHPELCRFISDQVYEGRLGSHPDTAEQAVRADHLPEAGAFFVPVLHEGNAQEAVEEVQAIKAVCQQLLTGSWTDKYGTSRPSKEADIIVVAPYNAQVNALRDALPPGVRVGTVDKFQGQEAPVCLVSMASSSADESGRGMEFLLSLNRINVAVSRGKALSLVFGNTRLREAKCTSLDQMRLVNTLCALPELNLEKSHEH